MTIERRGEDMRQYKTITIILSGVFIAIMIIVGINVLAFNKKQVAYEVDSNYTPKNEISEKINNEALINDNTSTTANNPIKETSVNTVKENEGTNTVKVENITDNEGQSQEAKVENVTDIQGTEEQGITATNDKKDVTESLESKQPSKEEEIIDNKRETNHVTNKDKGGNQQANDNIENTNEGTETNDQVDKQESDYTGHEWVDETIDDNREDIADTDLEIGLSIGDKIDDDILLGFMEDGLTEEEKESLQEYLEVVLTPEEYDELNVLFERYNHMFQE